MNSSVKRVLARELATKINRMVNIPFIGEDEEQVFFELIVYILLDMFMENLDSFEK